MKKLVLILLMFQVAISAQSTVEVSDDLIMEDTSSRKFKGEIVLNDGDIYLKASECEFSGGELMKLNLNKKKTKRWKKRISKNNNVIKGVTVVGSFDGKIIEVKKMRSPFKAPKKKSGATQVDNYVNGVFEAYKRLKIAVEESNYIKVTSEEVNDETLGVVTSYTYYDSNCKELSQEELIALKPKALSSLGRTGKAMLDLLDYQSQLMKLATLADAELKTLTGLKVLIANKNYIYAKVVSASLMLEIPKVISNANKTKKLLKQFADE
ncbi:MAG: hypothetical protein JKY08_09100 [Flavobacteriaceae bacterium]|nr:hypothetical protein [Flavobacteriaceae bacterium]